MVSVSLGKNKKKKKNCTLVQYAISSSVIQLRYRLCSPRAAASRRVYTPASRRFCMKNRIKNRDTNTLVLIACAFVVLCGATPTAFAQSEPSIGIFATPEAQMPVGLKADNYKTGVVRGIETPHFS